MCAYFSHEDRTDTADGTQLLYQKKSAMKHKLKTRLVSAWLAGCVASMLLLTAAPSFAQGVPEHGAKTQLPLANFTEFSDKELSAYLADNVKPELQQVVRDRGLVVVATTWAFDLDGGQACFANIGLSEAPPKGLNPRFPGFQFRSFSKGQEGNCVGESLRAAVSSFNNHSIEVALQDIEKTVGQGGIRKEKDSSRTTIHLRTSIQAKYDTGPLSEKLFAYNIGKAVDYRHVASAVQSFSTRFDDGSLMCVAQAGFAARSPEDRYSRIPGSMNAYAVLREGGSEADCEQAAALGAIEKLMKDPWLGKNGRMNNFNRTREDGVPPPDLKRMAAVEERLVAASQPAQRPVASRTAQVNRVSCTNRCVNGNCLRTFSNGTQERWQAPRRYNPMKNDWEWDTSSCGG